VRHNVAARLSPLAARCMKRVSSQCDILSQASGWLCSCKLCARCAACLLLSPLRGSGCSKRVTGIEWQMSMRHIVAGVALFLPQFAPAECTRKLFARSRGESYIEDTVLHKCHRPLRGIDLGWRCLTSATICARCAALRGVLGHRSCSPHVRALHPRPYSRGILTALSFVFHIEYLCGQMLVASVEWRVPPPYVWLDLSSIGVSVRFGFRFVL